MFVFLQNMRIKYKIVFVTMITCIAVLTATSAIIMFWTHATLRDSITRSLNTQAEILADNCKAAIAFETPDDARETLGALRTQAQVVGAAIYTKNNKFFAGYNRGKTDGIIELSQFLQGGNYAKDHLVVTNSIVLDGETVGTIVIKSDLSLLNNAFNRDLKIVGGLLAIAILMAYMLSSNLQKIISEPILELTSVAKKVSEKNEYSTRAVKQTNDEIGELIESFNGMLEQIQQRDGQLVEINEHLEDKVQERTSELTQEIARADAMAREALKASNIKSQFLANMSHEIRTPMNAVIGFSEILANDELTETQHEYIELIRKSGSNLMDIINDILDISKIEAGEIEPENIDCDIVKLLKSIEPLMLQKVKEKGIGFEIVKDPEMPSIISTDPTRLKQCLTNLIHNAIKFTKEGYVHVNVSPEKIGNKNFVRFDIVDTGIGIPRDKQQYVFKPFTQADDSHNRKFGGTGLGLAITKQLAEILGGKLTLTSKEGSGSVFSLVVPAGPRKAKQLSLDSDENEDSDNEENLIPVEFSGHVLVAEDVKANQMLIKLLMESNGLEVTIVADGNEAVEKSLTRNYDLIFMDMQMPNMNGYEAAMILRNKGFTTPIIALTANAMTGDDKKCIEAGCDGYLAKPIDRTELKNILAKYLPVPETVLTDTTNTE